jgi:hypothetical protein
MKNKNDYEFKAGADSLTKIMTISITKDGAPSSALEIDTGRSGDLAAIILRAAKEVHSRSGAPMPNRGKDNPIEFTVLRPTGFNIGPGPSPDTTTLLFYFGEATLGISAPQEALHTFAQRLLTATAPGNPQ